MHFTIEKGGKNNEFIDDISYDNFSDHSKRGLGINLDQFTDLMEKASVANFRKMPHSEINDYEEKLIHELEYEIKLEKESKHKPKVLDPIDLTDERRHLIPDEPGVDMNTRAYSVVQSPHWSRIDVRQKKVSRALSIHAKDFIDTYMKLDKWRKTNWLIALDNLMKTHFPIIYTTRKLQTLGCLGKICLISRFVGAVDD